MNQLEHISTRINKEKEVAKPTDMDTTEKIVNDNQNVPTPADADSIVSNDEFVDVSGYEENTITITSSSLN